MELKKSKDKQLLIEQLERKNIDFASFFLGLDVDIEKSIIKYINNCGGIVTFNELELYFVYKNDICSKNRLIKRLNSLINSKFILKIDDYKIINNYKKYLTFYILNLED